MDCHFYAYSDSYEQTFVLADAEKGTGAFTYGHYYRNNHSRAMYDVFRTTATSYAQAVKDGVVLTDENGELTGPDGALMKRINLIKDRVKQRGEQIVEYAEFQYDFQTLGIGIGEALCEVFSNPILFGGVDFDKCKVEIDTSPFELTDLQAIKILAMFSIQYDADMSSVEMWDIMDYCGWYVPGIISSMDTYAQAAAELGRDISNMITPYGMVKMDGKVIGCTGLIVNKK